MKKLFVFLLIAVLSFSIANASETETAYTILVSHDGSDMNDGITAPVATPARALELAGLYITEANVTIDIADGLYRLSEPLMINEANTDGEHGHTLTLQGHGGTYLSGSIPLTGWQQEKENVWYLELPEYDEVYGLVVDGMHMDIASQVMYGSFYTADGKNGIVKQYGDTYNNFSYYGNVNEKVSELYYTSMRFKKATLEELQADLANIRFRFNQTFMRECWTIEEITAGPDTGIYQLKFTQDTLDIINKAHMQDFEQSFDKCFVYGSRLFLDKENEYCFDRTAHKLYLYSSIDPNTRSCELPVCDKLIVINGTAKKLASNISIQNLGFTCNSDIYTMTHVYHEWSSMSFAVLMTEKDEGFDSNTVFRYYEIGAIFADTASNISIRNCEFNAIGMNAICLYERTYNTKIENCRFEELGGTAIVVGHPDKFSGFGYHDIYDQPADLEHVYAISAKKTAAMPGLLTISNNLIRNSGLRTVNACAIGVNYCSFTDITHNTIESAAGCGISTGNGCNNYSIEHRGVKYNGPFTITNNCITGTNRTAYDAGGIYTCGFQGLGSIIKDNFVDMNGAIKKDCPAIYLDEGTEYMTVTHNLSVNSDHWLSCRCLPIVYANGVATPGKKLANNTIMNSTVAGNFSDIKDAGNYYAPGIKWPPASEVVGANVTISDNNVVANWQNDTELMAIYENAGCSTNTGMYR